MKSKVKILVVDDDVQHVDTVKTLLESVGYAVDYAYLPEKAIDKARNSPPDLILLDVMFAGPPGPDGVETSRRIHQDPELRSIPVIILSGVRKVLDLPFRLEPDDEWMPVRAFLEKPVKPEKLLSEIEKALGR
jgi:CheY-like chemotaxis protein